LFFDILDYRMASKAGSYGCFNSLTQAAADLGFNTCCGLAYNTCSFMELPLENKKRHGKKTKHTKPREEHGVTL
jgi:hypothetical protein